MLVASDSIELSRKAARWELNSEWQARQGAVGTVGVGWDWWDWQFNSEWQGRQGAVDTVGVGLGLVALAAQQ